MARYMPFVIGALVAVCTACVFGCFSVGGVPGRSVPTSAGARQVSVAGMKEGLLASREGWARWFRSRSQEIPWYGVT